MSDVVAGGDIGRSTQPGPAPRGRPPIPQASWDAARADYQAGLSTAECCRRHGMGESTLRARARAEGWRRENSLPRWSADLDPWDEGVLLEAEVEGDVERLENRELWSVADRRMMRAVLRGDAAGALRWRKVKLMLDQEEAELDRWIAEEERAARLQQQRMEVQAAAEPDPDV